MKIKTCKVLSRVWLLVIFLACLFPVIVLAETGTAKTGSVLSEACSQSGVDATICKEEQQNNQLDGLIMKAVSALMYIVVVASVSFIIYGGIVYATSSGTPDKITKAKKTIMGAVIGLAVAMLALAIVNFVKKTVDGNKPADNETSVLLRPDHLLAG